MVTCLILRGVPGCGKSTIAAETGYEIVNRDSIREMLFGDAEVFSDEGLVTAVQDAMIEYHIKSGTSVVVDNTNVEWKYVTALAGLAYRAGATKVGIQVVDVPLDVALNRNHARGRMGGRQVPEHVIKHYYERLQTSKDWTL